MKKVIDFNNTWCEATQENYNKLIELEYSFIDEWDSDKFFIETEDKTFYCHSYLENEIQIKLNSNNEFEYVEQQPNFNEWKEIREDKPKDNSEQNSFNKYGFETPDFEGEILKCVKDRLIGYVLVDRKIEPIRWNLKGTSNFTETDKYNLAPIKKEWYEIEDNFPCVVTDGKITFIAYKFEVHGKDKFLHSSCEGFFNGFIARVEDFRPATKEEVLSLIVKDKN